jgi:hypothetical protein
LPSLLTPDKLIIVLETGIKITLVASPEMEVFGLRDREQVIKDIYLVRDAFGAQFDFEVDATIKERPPLDSDPKFDSLNHIDEPLDDDNLLGLACFCEEVFKSRRSDIDENADWLIRIIFEAVDRAAGGINAIAGEQVGPGTVQ